MKKNSFDFTVQTIGVYNNNELIIKACKLIEKRLIDLDTLIDTDEIEIKNSLNTMTNCYDIKLENEDYTIGKLIEYILYEKFFEGTKIVSYVGFKKFHPHDIESIVRIAFKQPVDISSIKGYLKECIHDAKNVFGKIKLEFVKK